MNTKGNMLTRVGLGVLFVGLCWAGWHLYTLPEPSLVAEVNMPVAVRTMTLNAAGPVSELHYFGTVQGSKKVELSFRVPGPLVELPFEMGAEVKKGDLLARIDARDFKTRVNACASELSQASAKLNEAQSNFKRYEELYRKKTVAQAQYDRYKTALNVAISNVKSAEAKLTGAQDALADTELRAPFDGTIVARMVENYQDVQAKQPVISLQNLNTVDITFQVPEQDIVTASQAKQGPPTLQTISQNLTLNISVTLEGVPGVRLDATLKEVGAQANAKTQTYPVTITMAQPENVPVLPGMPVNVTVRATLKKQQDVQGFFVPLSAVQGDVKQKSWVWQFVDGKAHKVAVTLGSMRGERIEIQGDLKPENVIITAGMQYLHEGDAVRILP